MDRIECFAHYGLVARTVCCRNRRLDFAGWNPREVWVASCRTVAGALRGPCGAAGCAAPRGSCLRSGTSPWPAGNRVWPASVALAGGVPVGALRGCLRGGGRWCPPVRFRVTCTCRVVTRRSRVRVPRLWRRCAVPLVKPGPFGPTVPLRSELAGSGRNHGGRRVMRANVCVNGWRARGRRVIAVVWRRAVAAQPAGTGARLHRTVEHARRRDFPRGERPRAPTGRGSGARRRGGRWRRADREDAPHRGVVGAAAPVEAHAARAAPEQLRAEVVLEGAHAVADGGGGDAELLGSAQEALVPRGGLEEAQGIEGRKGLDAAGGRRPCARSRETSVFSKTKLNYCIDVCIAIYQSTIQIIDRVIRCARSARRRFHGGRSDEEKAGSGRWLMAQVWASSRDGSGREMPEAGSRKPEAGSRKPEAGSRKPEAGSRKPEAGSRKPEAGSRKPEAGSRKPEAGSRKP